MLMLYFGATISWTEIGNIAATNITALFFVGIHIYCLIKISSDKNSNEFSLNLLVSLLGGLFGWVLGNIASPVSEKEKAVFSELGAAIATFLSGYVVSKIDRFLEAVLFSNGSVNKKSWISACFFISALIIVSITVFLNRFYTLSQVLSSGS